jgi:hypothetical protein
VVGRLPTLEFAGHLITLMLLSLVRRFRALVGDARLLFVCALDACAQLGIRVLVKVCGVSIAVGHLLLPTRLVDRSLTRPGSLGTTTA